MRQRSVLVAQLDATNFKAPLGLSYHATQLKRRILRGELPGCEEPGSSASSKQIAGYKIGALPLGMKDVPAAALAAGQLAALKPFLPVQVPGLPLVALFGEMQIKA